MIEWAIILVLVLFFGAFKGFADALQFRYEKSLPSKFGWDKNFWNPAYSYVNKYKKGTATISAPPELREPRFPFSTTALVFLTDGWHLINFLQYTCIELALALAVSDGWMTIIWFFAFKTLKGVGFKLMY